MKRPGPYLVLIEAKDEHSSVFQFDSLNDVESWMRVKDEDSPAKHNAKFLGTVFRPRDITPQFLESLRGFETLFAELEDVADRKRRAKARRASFKNRPNRR